MDLTAPDTGVSKRPATHDDVATFIAGKLEWNLNVQISSHGRGKVLLRVYDNGHLIDPQSFVTQADQLNLGDKLDVMVAQKAGAISRDFAQAEVPILLNITVTQATVRHPDPFLRALDEQGGDFIIDIPGHIHLDEHLVDFARHVRQAGFGLSMGALGDGFEKKRWDKIGRYASEVKIALENPTLAQKLEEEAAGKISAQMVLDPLYKTLAAAAKQGVPIVLVRGDKEEFALLFATRLTEREVPEDSIAWLNWRIHRDQPAAEAINFIRTKPEMRLRARRR